MIWRPETKNLLHLDNTTGEDDDKSADDGRGGGTGAAPMPLIDAVGLPLRESLPLLVDKLNEHGLRDRSVPLEKPSGTRRILLIGDSYTEGLEVELDKMRTIYITPPLLLLRSFFPNLFGNF